MKITSLSINFISTCTHNAVNSLAGRASGLALLSIALLFCEVGIGALSAHQNENNDLEEIREIERSVQAVVEKTMESTVAISDGVGFGSGVIVSPEGLILTAGHVMGSGSTGREFEIIFPSGKVARARALGKNLNLDAGMIQLIDPGPWPFVEMSESDPQISDWVVCLGHSGGYELGRKPPVRTGRVLGKRGEQIVTDAVLIGGDSGGPLFDLEGKLVAIHSSIGDTVAENRHVPISIYHTYWNRMQRGESWGKLPELAGKRKKKKQPERAAPAAPAAQRAKLGVVVDKSANLAIVESVRDRSPAQRVGLLPGDVIRSFDGRNVTGPQNLIDLVRTKSVGDSVSMRVQRGNYDLNFQIILDVLE